MEIKQAPQIGIPRFGIVYRQRAGGCDSFMSVDGVVVKITFWQRLKIKLKRMYVLLRRHIDHIW
jgi:hypothetical protein